MTREINAGEREPTAPRQEWRTPRALAALIVKRWAIDLDAMATADNRIVPRYIAPPYYVDGIGPERGPVAHDALLHHWAAYGSSIFLNPPFALLSIVTSKALQASEHGAHVVMLAPDNGDTRWYAAWVDAGAAVLRFRGRVAYEPAGEVEGKRGAAFPSALYVLPGFAHRRRPGDAVPTFAIDPRTLEVL